VIKSRLGSDFDKVVHRVLPFVRHVRVAPDTLTLLGVAVSVAAAVLLARDQLFWAGIVMAFAGFFDLIDGVVAREQGVASKAGAFFDSSMDRVADLVIFAGLAFAMATRGDAWGVMLVLWALGGSLMTSYLRARAECDLEHLGVGIMERAERCVVLILGALTGFMEVALWVVAVGSTVTAVQRTLVARRELKALGSAQGSASEDAPGEA